MYDYEKPFNDVIVLNTEQKKYIMNSDFGQQLFHLCKTYDRYVRLNSHHDLQVFILNSIYTNLQAIKLFTYAEYVFRRNDDYFIVINSNSDDDILFKQRRKR